ncbi:MAG: DUF2141 domain-containing protein [Crocinitomicaceae bacterium]|nr:DUF2141 domain-containing protein [Crocinitomicaceae bacterium]
MKRFVHPYSMLLLGGFFLLSSFKSPREIFPLPQTKSFTLTVVIENMRNNQGRLQLDLYKNQEEYAARESNEERRAYVYKKFAVNGSITYTYKRVPEGTYGIALFDDENSNGEIDYGWLLPKEGFGFGDYYHTKWSTPRFKDFKFYLSSNKTVTMVVRYL